MGCWWLINQDFVKPEPTSSAAGLLPDAGVAAIERAGTRGAAMMFLGARTTQADHIISLKARPDLGLESSNLVGMCGLHSRKTALEDGRWG